MSTLKEVHELREENKRLRKVIEDQLAKYIRTEKDKELLVSVIKYIHESKVPPRPMDEIQNIPTSILNDDSKPKINLEEATFIVKEVFAKIRGEPDMQGRRYIDCVGFDVISAKEKADGYSFLCEVGQSIFNHEKDRYEVEISQYGELLHLQREIERATTKSDRTLIYEKIP